MSLVQYKQPKTELGKHYIVELYNCTAGLLKTVEGIEQRFLDAATQSKATILNHFFHQFEPEGVSGVILIAESHFTIHTWPEHGYAAIDIFTCGEQMKPDIAVHLLKKSLEADDMNVYILDRGI